MIVKPDKFVFKGTKFIIYDLSDELPRHKNFPEGSTAVNPNTKKRDVVGHYRKIPGRQIDSIIVHQTAGGYGEYDIQVYREALFFIQDPSWKLNPRWGTRYQKQFVWTGHGRGWPGFAYTWYVPHEPLRFEMDGNVLPVIYQCNPLDWVTWHTGDGMNDNGGGLAFQGYFTDPKYGVTTPIKGTSGEPSTVQQDILSSFWNDYAKPVLGAKILTGHWEHGKPSCPGRTLREKVVQLREAV